MTGISSKMNTIVSSPTMLRFIFLQTVPGEMFVARLLDIIYKELTFDPKDYETSTN